VGIPIRISTESTAGLTRKEYLRAATATWRVVGGYWHREILPRHFLRRAIVTYRYQERGRRYEAAKLKRFGHKRPLVWSGKLRAQVTSAKSLLARRASVDIRVFGALNLSGFNARARMPDMTSEIQAVSGADERELARVLDKELTKRLSLTARRRKV